MVRTWLCFTLLAGLTITQPAKAQESNPQSVFNQIFPQPTGQNGYEEITAAGEMLAKSVVLRDLEQEGVGPTTLTRKRTVLADPPVRDALILFRQGIVKSLHAPRDKPREAGFKAFALYRRLARVLAMEQYVLCADGHVSQAIDSLQDSLRLGYAVQSDALIGGMVGVAIDSAAIGALQRHLDQLSDKDCRRLMQIARVWLNAPDPGIAAISVERDQVVQAMTEQFPPGADFPKAQVLAAMMARIDHYAANLSKPLWERKPPLPLQGNKLVVDYVNALAQTLDPVFEKSQDIFIRDQAKMQILGVHAAIRSYRWEHDALPSGLNLLKLGPLGQDPFTGKPLRYRTASATTYELLSEGLTVTAP